MAIASGTLTITAYVGDCGSGKFDRAIERQKITPPAFTQKLSPPHPLTPHP
ncbi:hypothetical protein [Microcoleus sp. herbarium14]|uniref:hypothetical protein n=1 Tax=Microcoleus sp. herbarium14 TaxID=3055439 RepID=UPI002FCF528F